MVEENSNSVWAQTRLIAIVMAGSTFAVSHRQHAVRWRSSPNKQIRRRPLLTDRWPVRRSGTGQPTEWPYGNESIPTTIDDTTTSADTTNIDASATATNTDGMPTKRTTHSGVWWHVGGTRARRGASHGDLWAARCGQRPTERFTDDCRPAARDEQICIKPLTVDIRLYRQ
jgi:hypothetical protein